MFTPEKVLKLSFLINFRGFITDQGFTLTGTQFAGVCSIRLETAAAGVALQLGGILKWTTI
jgi:hypothetical protein